VEKDSFIKVLHHYSASSVEDAQDVLSLKDTFPYSQLLHALSARLSRDHGFSNQQAELQLAAIYAADRAVLKDVMTQDAFPAKTEPQLTKATVKPDPKPILTVPPVAQVPQAEDVADKVIHDLERLHELRHNFEMMFVDTATAEIKTTKPKVTVEKSEEPTVAPLADNTTTHPKESSKSKKERIIELAKAMQAEKASDPEPQKPKTKKKKNPGEDIIEEIVSSKEEIQPESEKQKEQLEIIEQFIKTQPTISNTKDKPIVAPVGDLAVIKSGEFGDNIVSETLVEILIKQGKKDKAIEVLKKLIWKFPQKKAYFAAQIEDLKK
jgi:hypothetical protein